MTIDTIFFDVGGVLVRTIDRVPRQQLAARLGITYEKFEELVYGGENGRRAQCGEISATQQWLNVCAMLGWPAENVSALRAQFYGGDQVDFRLVDAIRSLRLTYHTGVISNAMDDARPFLEQEAGIGDAFERMFFSYEVGVMKPDERIFQAALRELHICPEASVFIDDFVHNVEGARAVGMHAIHFRSSEQALQELHALLDGQR